jgi:hypothetical protein
MKNKRFAILLAIILFALLPLNDSLADWKFKLEFNPEPSVAAPKLPYLQTILSRNMYDLNQKQFEVAFEVVTNPYQSVKTEAERKKSFQIAISVHNRIIKYLERQLGWRQVSYFHSADQFAGTVFNEFDARGRSLVVRTEVSMSDEKIRKAYSKQKSEGAFLKGLAKQLELGLYHSEKFTYQPGVHPRY